MQSEAENNFNYTTQENGATIKFCSSEEKNCPCSNILSPDRKSIWLSEKPVPQIIIIDLTNLKKQSKDFKYWGIYCWHAYSTNPKLIELHISEDNSTYISLGTYEISMKPGKQVFPIKSSPSKIDLNYIKLNIKSSHGGARTYINQIYFYDENFHMDEVNKNYTLKSNVTSKSDLKIDNKIDNKSVHTTINSNQIGLDINEDVSYELVHPTGQVSKFNNENDLNSHDLINRTSNDTLNNIHNLVTSNDDNDMLRSITDFDNTGNDDRNNTKKLMKIKKILKTKSHSDSMNKMNKRNRSNSSGMNVHNANANTINANNNNIELENYLMDNNDNNDNNGNLDRSDSSEDDSSNSNNHITPCKPALGKYQANSRMPHLSSKLAERGKAVVKKNSLYYESQSKPNLGNKSCDNIAHTANNTATNLNNIKRQYTPNIALHSFNYNSNYKRPLTPYKTIAHTLFNSPTKNNNPYDSSFTSIKATTLNTINATCLPKNEPNVPPSENKYKNPDYEKLENELREMENQLKIMNDESINPSSNTNIHLSNMNYNMTNNNFNSTINKSYANQSKSFTFFPGGSNANNMYNNSNNISVIPNKNYSQFIVKEDMVEGNEMANRFSKANAFGTDGFDFNFLQSDNNRGDIGKINTINLSNNLGANEGNLSNEEGEKINSNNSNILNNVNTHGQINNANCNSCNSGNNNNNNNNLLYDNRLTGIENKIQNLEIELREMKINIEKINSNIQSMKNDILLTNNTNITSTLNKDNIQSQSNINDIVNIVLKECTKIITSKMDSLLVQNNQKYQYNNSNNSSSSFNNFPNMPSQQNLQNAQFNQHNNNVNTSVDSNLYTFENKLNKKMEEKFDILANNIENQVLKNFLQPSINEIENKMKENLDEIKNKINFLNNNNPNLNSNNNNYNMTESMMSNSNANNNFAYTNTNTNATNNCGNNNYNSSFIDSYRNSQSINSSQGYGNNKNELSSTQKRNERYDEINRIGEKLYDKLVEKEKKLRDLKNETNNYLKRKKKMEEKRMQGNSNVNVNSNVIQGSNVKNNK